MSWTAKRQQALESLTTLLSEESCSWTDNDYGHKRTIKVKHKSNIAYFDSFTELEKSFIHNISQWIGSKIKANLTLKEFESNKHQFERAIKSVQDGRWVFYRQLKIIKCNG